MIRIESNIEKKLEKATESAHKQFTENMLYEVWKFL